MKKPFNKFAILLWVLAVLAPSARGVGIGRLYEALFRIPSPTGQSGNNFTPFTPYTLAGAEISGMLLTFGQLAAFAVLIELIDQIRWIAIQNRTIH